MLDAACHVPTFRSENKGCHKYSQILEGVFIYLLHRHDKEKNLATFFFVCCCQKINYESTMDKASSKIGPHLNTCVVGQHSHRTFMPHRRVAPTFHPPHPSRATGNSATIVTVYALVLVATSFQI